MSFFDRFDNGKLLVKHLLFQLIEVLVIEKFLGLLGQESFADNVQVNRHFTVFEFARLTKLLIPFPSFLNETLLLLELVMNPSLGFLVALSLLRL